MSECDSDDEFELKSSKVKCIAGTKKCSWSSMETLKLVMGVQMFGAGNWAKIKAHWPSVFEKRTSSQLKDKYRWLKNHELDLTLLEKKAKTEIKKIANLSNLSR